MDLKNQCFLIIIYLPVFLQKCFVCLDPVSPKLCALFSLWWKSGGQEKCGLHEMFTEVIANVFKHMSFCEEHNNKLSPTHKSTWLYLLYFFCANNFHQGDVQRSSNINHNSWVVIYRITVFIKLGFNKIVR